MLLDLARRPPYDAKRVPNFFVARPECFVRQSDLARMNAGLAKIAETMSRFCFFLEPIRILHRGEGRVIGPDAGFAGRKAHRELDLWTADVVLPIDPQGLEQVGEAESEGRPPEDPPPQSRQQSADLVAIRCLQGYRWTA